MQSSESRVNILLIFTFFLPCHLYFKYCTIPNSGDSHNFCGNNHYHIAVFQEGIDFSVSEI